MSKDKLWELVKQIEDGENPSKLKASLNIDWATIQQWLAIIAQIIALFTQLPINK